MIVNLAHSREQTSSANLITLGSTWGIMLRMKALGRLVEWRNREHGALLVTGMPKTGKTALIEEFGRTYEHFVRIDLRGNPDLKSIFKRGSDAESVSKGVSACTDMEIVPGSTLLFIDGIQGCREALASLTRLSIDS